MGDHIRKFLWTLGLLFTSLSLVALIGSLHPIGDSVSVFLPLLAAILVILGLFAWLSGAIILAQMIGFIGGLLFFWLGIHFLPYSKTPLPFISVYQKNMFIHSKNWPELARDIHGFRPDVVTLQEIFDENHNILQELKASYPVQHVCGSAYVRSVAVLTHFEPTGVPAVCLNGRGVAAIQVEGPDGAIWLVSVHLNWPWPFPQAADAQTLNDWLDTLDAPVILAGDFNMVPWSHRLRQVARKAQGHLAGPPRMTF